MPTYEYQCSTCSEVFECRLSVADSDTPQSCACGGPGTKLISLPSFILKGDGWVGKNLRIEGQMRKKNERLDARQNELRREAPVATLVPNVAGERTESWSEAQSLAASRGKDASTYTPMVAAEKAAKK